MKVSLSFLMMSKSMSASAGPTTPGAHLIPMLMSPEGHKCHQLTNLAHKKVQLQEHLRNRQKPSGLQTHSFIYTRASSVLSHSNI